MPPKRKKKEDIEKDLKRKLDGTGFESIGKTLQIGAKEFADKLRSEKKKQKIQGVTRKDISSANDRIDLSFARSDLLKEMKKRGLSKGEIKKKMRGLGDEVDELADKLSVEKLGLSGTDKSKALKKMQETRASAKLKAEIRKRKIEEEDEESFLP